MWACVYLCVSVCVYMCVSPYCVWSLCSEYDSNIINYITTLPLHQEPAAVCSTQYKNINYSPPWEVFMQKSILVFPGIFLASMENTLRWNMDYNNRRSSVEANLWWKTTFHYWIISMGLLMWAWDLPNNSLYLIRCPLYQFYYSKFSSIMHQFTMSKIEIFDF